MKNDKIVKLQERLKFLSEQNKEINEDLLIRRREVGDANRASGYYEMMKDEYDVLSKSQIEKTSFY